MENTKFPFVYKGYLSHLLYLFAHLYSFARFHVYISITLWISFIGMRGMQKQKQVTFAFTLITGGGGGSE